MADVNFTKQPLPAANAATPSAIPDGPQPGPDIQYDLIELLFFAYRDFTADPDDALAGFEFGRAHHRVLHFVDRNPGIKVTDLLSILRITKQSLGRVLKQLVDQEFIEQRPGPHDRRQRLLNTTGKGHALAVQLAHLQTKRLEGAIMGLPEDSAEVVRQFLFQMINPDGRPEVAQLVGQPADPGLPVPPLPEGNNT